jgi:hypothetical protein
VRPIANCANDCLRCLLKCRPALIVESIGQQDDGFAPFDAAQLVFGVAKVLSRRCDNVRRSYPALRIDLALDEVVDLAFGDADPREGADRAHGETIAFMHIGHCEDGFDGAGQARNVGELLDGRVFGGVDDAEALSEVTSAVAVAPEVWTGAQVVANGVNTGAQIAGVTPNHAQVRNLARRIANARACCNIATTNFPGSTTAWRYNGASCSCLP